MIIIPQTPKPQPVQCYFIYSDAIIKMSLIEDLYKLKYLEYFKKLSYLYWLEFEKMSYAINMIGFKYFRCRLNVTDLLLANNDKNNSF